MQTKSINSNNYIYVGFVNTPGFFASIIRRVIAQKYIHVVLGLDPELKEAYSVGRRNPSVPIIAGFEKEEKDRILKAFPTAEYQICRIPCTREQRQYIEVTLRQCMEERYRYHYTVLGLPFILWNKPFYQENHFTCSSYLAKVLESAGVLHFSKHFSLVTPKDFMEYPDKEVVFEGTLQELVDKSPQESYDLQTQDTFSRRGHRASVVHTGVIKYEC